MTASEPVVRRAAPDDAAELAELFWRVREQSVPAIPMIAHPREWPDGDNEEGAPDVLMLWSPAAGAPPIRPDGVT